MKTIGLIGGMSWESTTHYYQQINQNIKQQLGGFHSAKILLYSVDFAEIEALQRAGEWQQAGDMLAQIAVKLEQAGADVIVICTNTMHLVAPQVEEAIDIPLLHIADVTAQAIVAQSINKVALLGTAFTMQQPFLKQRIHDQYAIEVIVPELEDQQTVHDIIYQELVLGVINEASRQRYLEIVARLIEKGAQGVILGCTEIGMLLDSTVTDTPLFDTTQIHAKAATAFALEGA